MVDAELACCRGGGGLAPRDWDRWGRLGSGYVPQDDESLPGGGEQSAVRAEGKLEHTRLMGQRRAERFTARDIPQEDGAVGARRGQPAVCAVRAELDARDFVGMAGEHPRLPGGQIPD